MLSDQSRRRLLFGAGSVLFGGSVAALSDDIIANSRPAGDFDQLGADDLTAGTIPASTDTLAVVQLNRAEPPEAVRAVAGLVAEASPFVPVPIQLRGLVSTDSSKTVDPSRIGKLAFVGSADGHGAVVVWADWTKDHFAELVSVSGSDDHRTEIRHGKSMYTAGDTAGSMLTKTAFVVGHPSVVADTIGVWHGDEEPVGDSTLSTYDLTRRQSPFRFTLGEIRLPCDCITAVRKPQVYNNVTRLYGSLSKTGALRVSLGLDSKNSENTAALAATLRRDIGLTEGVSARIDLPSEAISKLSVLEGSDAVTVRFPSADTPPPSTLTELFGGIAQLVSGE